MSSCWLSIRRRRVGSLALPASLLAAALVGGGWNFSAKAVRPDFSRFNPIAESEFGAKGLMQIIPKYHVEQLRAMGGGEHSVLDPHVNVTLGARILKDYIRRTGSLESGLQWYAGALSDTSSEYAQRVIAEQQRLRQAIVRPGTERSSPV